MAEERVTVIIKAANQSSPDQRVECDASWSVLTLKSHLAGTHPARPRAEEQRLIYSGQLLLDNLLLRDILRRPSEDNAYTIHLVCSPPPVTVAAGGVGVEVAGGVGVRGRGGGGGGSVSSSTSSSTSIQQSQSSPPPPAMPDSSSSSSSTSSSSASSSTAQDGQITGESTDGLRRRHPAAPAAPPTIAEPPAFLQVGGMLQPSADPMHQVAAMQQLYAHYMAYVQYMQMGGGVGGLPWPQQMIQIPPPPNPATTTTTTAEPPLDQPPAPPPPQPDDPLPQPMPQPQQPIRMNAQGGEVDEDDEEGAGRDWLDWVYMLSRLMVLLFIVYFYSTLSRFMMVVFIAMLLYLYQAGWFRPSRRADQPPIPPPQQPQPQPQDAQANPAQPNNNNTPAVHEEEEEEDEEDEEEEEEEEEGLVRRGEGGEERDVVIRPSLLSLSWTFLTSFFTSLIPEQPQGI